MVEIDPRFKKTEIFKNTNEFIFGDFTFAKDADGWKIFLSANKNEILAVDEELVRFIFISNKINQKTADKEGFSLDDFLMSRGIHEREKTLDFSSSVRTFLNCHQTMQLFLKLQKNIMNKGDFKNNMLPEFTNLNWEIASDPIVAMDAQPTESFPKVGMISENEDGSWRPHHSFLVLGKLGGRYVCYQKDGYHDEFLINFLDELINENKNDQFKFCDAN